MNRNDPNYQALIRAGGSVICFLLAMAFWYGFRKTGVPFLLVGTGWFLRSVIHRTAAGTDAKEES